MNRDSRAWHHGRSDVYIHNYQQGTRRFAGGTVGHVNLPHAHDLPYAQD